MGCRHSHVCCGPARLAILCLVAWVCTIATAPSQQHHRPQTLPIATRQLNTTHGISHRRLLQTTRTLVITANASLTLTVTDVTAGTSTTVSTGAPLVLTGNRAYVLTYPNNVPYVPTFTYTEPGWAQGAGWIRLELRIPTIVVAAFRAANSYVFCYPWQHSFTQQCASGASRWWDPVSPVPATLPDATFTTAHSGHTPHRPCSTPATTCCSRRALPSCPSLS